MIPVIVAPWVVFTLVAAILGNEREIGIGESIMVSLVFSPVIGLLFVLASKRNKDIEHDAKVIELLEQIKAGNASLQP